MGKQKEEDKSIARFVPGEYYHLKGKKIVICSMCQGNRAEFMAPETSENLCVQCTRRNDEARKKK